jgi:hypothetical protein
MYFNGTANSNIVGWVLMRLPHAYGRGFNHG